MSKNLIVGIDEAGRGPIAGPVCVGMIFVEKGNERYLRGIKDSKKLSEKKREEWFKKIKNLEKERKLNFSYKLVSSRVIDRKGIVFAIKQGVEGNLKGINTKAEILLDGGLKAPEKFKKQKTIIKGDEKIRVISSASIVAKVMRDRMMVSISGKLPEYGFERHKGYGTKEHYKAIKKYGLTEVHRKTFINT